MYEQQMAQFGFVPFNQSKPIEFEVKLNGIYDAKGRKIPGHSAVVRTDTGDTLAVHSDKYQLVLYQTHFDSFERAIKASRLRWETMQVRTDMQDNGAKIFRQYLFPEHLVEIKTYGGIRPIALSIFMFDSYDGSTAFQGRTGAFDFICCNGLVMGKTVDQVRFKHIGDVAFKVEEAAERLTEAADQFVAHMDRMQRWTTIDLKAIEFSELVADMPQANPRLTDTLTAEFGRQGGANLWDAHNVLTSWATHNVPVKTQADRQKRVAELVESELWTRLEAVG